MLIQSQNNTDTYRFWGNIESRKIGTKHHIRIHSRETGWVTVGEYCSENEAKRICNEIVQSYIQRQKDIYYCPTDIA